MWTSSYNFPLQQFIGFLPTLQPYQLANAEALPLPRQNRTWMKAQSAALYKVCKYYCEAQCKPQSSLTLADFQIIAQGFNQSPLQCMAKFQELSVSGTLKPGVWSQCEDELLISLLSGEKPKWSKVAAVLNTQVHRGLPVRTGKKCKERWNNHVNPGIRRGEWSREEDLRLMQAFQQLGNQWSRISRLLGDRTESAVKNRTKSLLNRARQTLGVLHSDGAVDLILKQLSN